MTSQRSSRIRKRRPHMVVLLCSSRGRGPIRVLTPDCGSRAQGFACLPYLGPSMPKAEKTRLVLGRLTGIVSSCSALDDPAEYRPRL